MKKYNIIVEEEDILLLQKYNYEILGYSNLLEKILVANRTDANILESAAWKAFYNQYQEALVGYDVAKNNFTHKIIKPIIYQNEGKEVDFDWEIKDLLIPVIDILVKED